MATSLSEAEIPTLCFGFTLGFMVLTGSKIARQTISIYRRTKSIMSIYLFMVWLEWLVNLAWGLIAWLFLRGNIKASFGFFFTIAALWTIQTQCLIQIIANRVALVMIDKRKSRMLKLSLLIAVGLINVSVFIVWIPARMEVSHTWVVVNQVWDRVEKVIYLFIDLALNIYFLYLVRAKLIDRGLTKYKPLFRFNAGIVVISIAMDAMIIGMMSLPNDFVYTQFHSLAYIVKLNIELSMADLISKVVRKQDRTDKPYEHGSSSNPTGKGTEFSLRSRAAGPTPFAPPTSDPSAPKTEAIAYSPDAVRSDSSSEESYNFVIPENGIVKTVATTMHEERQPRKSTSSSTAQLNEYQQSNNSR